MIAFNRAFILIGWNRRADGEARRDANAARKGYEISVKVAAVSSARVASVNGVAAPPACARFIVTHPAHDMIVQRFRALEIIGFSRDRIARQRFECLVHRNELFRPEITRDIFTVGGISGFLSPNDTISQLDCLSAV